jgi:peroxiredoxin
MEQRHVPGSPVSVLTTPRVGEPARPLRLPAAQGGEVGLDDYRDRQAVIVWFTKGMACPFCRQKASQLARGAAQFRAAGGELLQVTVSKPDRARLYARQFALPFPYLCDPDFGARSAWGMPPRSHGLPWYAKTLVKNMAMPKPPNDFGNFMPAPAEIPNLLVDDDMGLFVVDRKGVVRYAVSGSYMSEAGPRPLPGNDELVRALEACATGV